MRFSIFSMSALALTAAAPAMAQDATPATGQDTPATPTEGRNPASATVADTTASAPAIKVTGGATLISDYRFRGLTQSDSGPAAQGTINVNSKLGFYVGTFVSTIDGSGKTPLLTGYGDVEVDLYGGYTKTLPNGLGIDAGLLYYYYASAKSGLNTDFFEPYASLTYTLGPVAAKAGAAYAWGGQSGLDFTGGKDDNLYLYGEGSVGIPTTPVSLKGHVGRTRGSLGLANLNPDNHGYWDWSATAEGVGGPLKVGVSYVDTTITSRYIPAFRGQFNQHLGRGWTVLGYVGLTF
jgi:uncharacterized protein (TIGR02001 family)